MSDTEPLNNQQDTNYGSELNSNTGDLPATTKATDESCCGCWTAVVDAIKDLRFELLLVAVLLCTMTAPSYFVAKMATTDFNYHRECVECFTQNKVGFGFNQTNQLCVYLSNFTINQNEVVLSVEFCGAPQCQSQVLLPGVRPVPYWLMLVSSFFAILFSILVNIIKDKCLLPMKRRFYESRGWELKKPDDVISKLCDEDCVDFRYVRHHDGSSGLPTKAYGDKEKKFANEEQKQADLANARIMARAVKFCGVIDPYYYLFLYITTIAHFIFIIYDVSSSPLYSEFTGWKKYETIYALWLNSGTLEVQCIFYSQSLFLTYANKKIYYYSSWMYDEIGHLATPFRFFSDYCDWRLCVFLHLIPSLLIPILLTHVIPAASVFIPISIALIGIFLTVSTFLDRKTNDENLDSTSAKVMVYVKIVFLRILGTFCMVGVFQTLANYSIMFYSGDYNWPEVIKYEFLHRSTECYANTFLNELQVYNVGLAGLIFA